MSADTTSIPWIRGGQIRSVRTLRWLPAPRGRSPSAVVVYDDNGNLHLRVVYDRPLGQVPTPRGVPPGTRSFGDALEPLILARLARFTGQSFRPRRPGATSAPDPEEGKLNEVSPTVHRWTLRARRQAQDWSQQGAGPRPNREGWLNSQAAKMLAIVGRLSVPEIDIVLGALTALERVVGKTPRAVHAFRSAARGRLGLQP
jgi:hypothetical protein